MLPIDRMPISGPSRPCLYLALFPRDFKLFSVHNLEQSIIQLRQLKSDII